ncbi:MAG: PH domain-containing protein [Lachnospiraceae bacterium]|nr:PH domain-containing protein [Lachnospiraceae bacterium]
MEFQSLHKKAISCMYAAALLGILAASAILTFLMYYFSLFSEPILTGIYIFLIALLILYGIFSPPFRYRRYRYVIDEECIDIQEGFLWLEEHIVPIERLHQIALSQGPIDRMFDLTKVIVTTAGGEVTIRFLEYEKASFLAEALKKKINQIALSERTENHLSKEDHYDN